MIKCCPIPSRQFGAVNAIVIGCGVGLLVSAFPTQMPNVDGPDALG